jgi:DNA-binding response OmpR family regulator
VVEDDGATARVVKGALAEAGFTVETLDKGFLLVAVVLRFQPDLLLLDINLPDMRGDTAMKMVRRAANVGDVRPLPVVILSGLPIEQLMEIQGHLGAVGCIQKPASLDTIVDRVCQILSVQRKDRPAPADA